jgi:RNA-binding protein YlmH
MTRADLIAAVRTASGKPYLPERECLAIVRGVLGVVREPVMDVLVRRRGIYRTIADRRDPFAEDCVNLHGLASHGVDVMEYAETEMTAMIDALLGEIAE